MIKLANLELDLSELRTVFHLFPKDRDGGIKIADFVLQVRASAPAASAPAAPAASAPAASAPAAPSTTQLGPSAPSHGLGLTPHRVPPAPRGR